MEKDLNVFFKYLERENITIDVDEFYFQYKSYIHYYDDNIKYHLLSYLFSLMQNYLYINYYKNY